jgi:DNA-directed RNA polymerase II subunit RPB2
MSTSEDDVFRSVAKNIHKIFLRDIDLVGHNIDSFDQGIDNLFRSYERKEWVQVSKDFGEEVLYRFKLMDFTILPPKAHNDVTKVDEEILPRDCIERSMTYEGMLRGTLQVTIEGTFHSSRLRESLAPISYDFFPIPIPVGSRHCNTMRELGALHPDVYRLRGCFVIKGQKKNIVCFETPSTNFPVFLHGEDGYYYEIRSHSRYVLGPVDVTSTQYANMIFMKSHVLMFRSRSFKTNRTKAITLVNLLMNLGLDTEDSVRQALLGSNPSDELREALAMTLSNTDDFPFPADIRAKFGTPPASLVSHLGRKATSTIESMPPERHAAWAQSILEREILPHCGGTDAQSRAAKTIVLCTMARRVALATYRSARGVSVKIDNRDDIMNKYIKGYADLIQELFVEAMKSVREKIHAEIRKTERNQRPPAPLTRASFPVNLPCNLPDAMKTIGNGQISSRVRGKPSKGPTRKGLTQTYGRLNISDDIACLRNFKNPINKQSKQESIRQIQASAYGYYCPSETREGQDVGLDHALALQATTTLHCSVDAVMASLSHFEGLRTITHMSPCEVGAYVVYVNGMPVYEVSSGDAQGLVEHMRNARRQNVIDMFTSITLGAPYTWSSSSSSSSSSAEEEEEEDTITPHEIHVRTGAGRLTAVYLTVNADTGLPVLFQRMAVAMALQEQNPETADELEAVESLVNMHFNDLLCPLVINFRGQVYEFPAAAEWIDGFERINVVLGENMVEPPPGATHVMIHPSLILGSAAAEVPFPDHNQSPRNAYQCGMGKQAIAGKQITDVIDGNIPPHLLYPQRQLCQTEYTRMILDKHPCPAGFNGVVAIMSYLGNQEDAIIVNRDSIQRGMGVSMHYQTYTDTALNTGLQYESGLSQADKFAFPDTDKVCRGKSTIRRFDHIDENGLAIVGSMVKDGDPIICKLRRFQSNHECLTTMRGMVCKCEYASFVTCYRGNDTAVVDRVQVTTNGTGDTLVNIVVRYVRAPNCGDKLASRHGQKGTIGRVVAREDLPFTVRDGIPPDIIINPHAIPSRMTVAHLIETLAGAYTCVTGEDTDATCFQKDWTVEKMSAALKEHGYHPECEEMMMCGMTGQMIEGSIFMGPIFYQRMKQMPSDKAHARALGQVMMSTRQPRGGRSEKGGFRLGEMEKDCVTSHGASSVIKERFTYSSDPYMIYVCDVCSRPCIGNADERKRVFNCTTCGNTDVDKMSIVELPYAGKLLVQEVMGLRVGVDLVTENALAIRAASTTASAAVVPTEFVV